MDVKYGRGSDKSIRAEEFQNKLISRFCWLKDAWNGA